MVSEKKPYDLAIIAITRKASELALRIHLTLPNSICYLPRRLEKEKTFLQKNVSFFDNLSVTIKNLWKASKTILCIMATGIVVRTISSLIKEKSKDPAILVMDEEGNFVISLLSGHLGGANALARKIADLVGATPVITTSSDIQKKVALDLLAQQKNLVIFGRNNNLSPTLPSLMRMLLEEETVYLFDPEGFISKELGDSYPNLIVTDKPEKANSTLLWVSEKEPPPELPCFRIHPKNLLVGIGCNRNTSSEEIIDFIRSVFIQERLYIGSVSYLVTVDIKKEEKGLLKASKVLGIPIEFVEKDKLENIKVPNPSGIVKKHIGVFSVCESAPIAFNKKAQIIVPKRKTKNVTIAVAKVSYS